MNLVSIPEAAHILHVHPARVAHWIAVGRLHAVAVTETGRDEYVLDRVAVEDLQALLNPRPISEKHEEVSAVAEGSPAGVDPLERARAVESYTAGLAATAIAPAVSRLVETIERLIAENGELREQNGRLKAQLELPSGRQPMPDRTPDVQATEETVETTHTPDRPGPTADWTELSERLDRLSEPMITTNAAIPTPGLEPKDSERVAHDTGVGSFSRPRTLPDSPYLRPRRKQPGVVRSIRSWISRLLGN